MFKKNTNQRIKATGNIIDSFEVEIIEEIIREFRIFGYTIKITKETEQIKNTPRR